MFQVGPEPDGVAAVRRLPDDRYLAVFRRDPELVVVERPRVVGIEPDGAGGYRLVTRGRTRLKASGPVEWELVVSDNTREPLNWRRVGRSWRRKESAMRRFRDFREGDDDRRRDPVGRREMGRRRSDQTRRSDRAPRAQAAAQQQPRSRP